MRILQINQTYKLGSTGKIMCDMNDAIYTHGHEGYMLCAYSNECKDNLYVMDKRSFPLNSKINILKMRLTGINGYSKKKETEQAIRWIKSVNPSLIHLHNVHGDWINLKMLFEYIKNSQIPVVWTLHDCWAFTGRCSNFELCGCEKWKTGCYACKNRKVYPITYLFDFSKKMWIDKLSWFSGLDAHIVTPSDWLSNYVRESFLKEYPVSVIHNGINTDLFHFCNEESPYLEGCKGKKIILGVANSWSKRKGFEDFLKISEYFRNSEYQVVMVGLNKKQKDCLPPSVIGIERTNNQNELVGLYSAADVFVNPTYEDNYPTTNLEAVSCGTLAVTYNTGGSPESIISSEYVIDQGDIETLCRVIKQVCEDKPYSSLELQNYGKDHFDKKDAFLGYIELYEKIEREK